MKGQATGLLIFLTISFSITKCSPSEKNEDASQLDHQETSSSRQTTYVRVKGYKEKGVLIRKGIPYGSDTSGGNRWKTKKNLPLGKVRVKHGQRVQLLYNLTT